MVSVSLFVPVATTFNVSVAVGPAVGVCVLVTPVVTLTNDPTIPERTCTVMTQDELAAIWPPVNVRADAPGVAVNVPVQVFGATAAIFTRLTEG